ncbi:hypothetical protein L7F22_031449 [Adiantum nelumboides]|nr:hypothetical protein [Adiantum nelumboides]
MLEGYPRLFIDAYNQITGVFVVQHHINLKDEAKPMVQRLRRLGVIQQDALLSEVRKLLNAGFIYPVEDSEWVSPVKNKKLRVCVDYKPLNATTKRDHFPLPFQDEILNEVAGYERSYLLPKKFVILIVEDTFPLVLEHMDVSARISKWLAQLQEFEYTVQVESSTQASLAGMLTHQCYERKVKVKAPRPEPVELQAKLSGAHSLYFDGAYKRKVDKASVGISIQDENGHKVFGKGLLVENTRSNNEAEYTTLALGLEWCVSMGIKRLNVFGDALLLIKQVHGTWACCNQSLVPRLRRVKELMKRFEAIQLYHVPRKGNQEADALASEHLQEVIVGAIKLQNPLFQGSDCMHDIVNFLETRECPQDMSKGQRQWLVRKATIYRLINEHLYCKGKDLVLRRVPHSEDIKQVLTSCHEGVCGGHFAHDITSRKILQAGYVWPSLHCDVQHWYKTCKQCQLASDRHLTYEPQTPILSYGPFEKWGIDAIGPLPRSTSGKLYIIMGVDYMTRWAKATTSARITAKDVATKNEGTPGDRLKQRILDLERLELDWEMAIEHYATQAEKHRQKFNEGLKDKELKRGMLVLRYDNRFDTRKNKKFMSRWKGPHVIRKRYTNGSYRLQDISGKLHKTRVNGWRLKPYFQRFDAEVVVNLPPKTSEEEEEEEASSSQQPCDDEDLLEA